MCGALARPWSSTWESGFRLSDTGKIARMASHGVRAPSTFFPFFWEAILNSASQTLLHMHFSLELVSGRRIKESKKMHIFKEEKVLKDRESLPWSIPGHPIIEQMATEKSMFV